MKNYPFISIFICFLSFSVLSCSVSQKISRSAKESLLNSTALKNAHTGISIYDTDKKQYLYHYNDGKYFTPASNTKIFTCYAAMKHLGDSLLAFTYRTENDAMLEIEPCGDPSFLHPDFDNSRTLAFLKKYFALGIYYGHWDEKPLGPGWPWDDYTESYMPERSPLPVYGNIARFFENKKDSKAELMVTPGYFKDYVSGEPDPDHPGQFEIRRSIDKNIFSISPSDRKFSEAGIPFVTNGAFTAASLLADTLHIQVNTYPYKLDAEYKFYSRPTDDLLKIMMNRSDNFFAEQTLLMVSYELLGYMKQSAIIDSLLKSDLKDLPQQPRWADGSGLSRYNLFTPQSFVTILDRMYNEFGMERIKRIFATGGQGTLSSLYKNDSGYIYAKTGTLSGQLALSGFLITRKNKLLIFSVLVNNHRSGAAQIRKLIEKFLSGIRQKL